jgi:hypothetical protein
VSAATGGWSVRQKAAEERETVLMFRNGQTEEAVRRKDVIRRGGPTPIGLARLR